MHQRFVYWKWFLLTVFGGEERGSRAKRSCVSEYDEILEVCLISLSVNGSQLRNLSWSFRYFVKCSWPFSQFSILSKFANFPMTFPPNRYFSASLWRFHELCLVDCFVRGHDHTQTQIWWVAQLSAVKKILNLKKTALIRKWRSLPDWAW